MSITTISSRAFNQDSSGAKKASEKGPVIITVRGKPAHVLLSIEEYRRLAGARHSLGAALAQMEEGDFAFDPQPLSGPLHRLPDLG